MWNNVCFRKTMLENIKNIHFVGIGGYGMSALAKILIQKGLKVSGSDLKENNFISTLRQKRATIYTGEHKSSSAADCQMLIYSSAIKQNNPEILYAKERSIPIMHRGELLAHMVNEKYGIIIAGAHGKTTTAGLSSMLLNENGFSPTVLIGEEVDEFGGNAMLGESKYVICESDESDGSFLKLNPEVAIVTNIDKEHMDYYKDMNDVLLSYTKFIENIKQNGLLIGCIDCQFLSSVLFSVQKQPVITYGLSDAADIRAEDIHMDKVRACYNCIVGGKNIGKVNLLIPGMHNIVNSLAVVGLGLYLNIPFKDISRSLLKYHGAKRRFQIKMDGGVMVVDDYAHHPNEIIATIKTAKLWSRRIVAVFQPHRYTRTYFLRDEFTNCFSEADLLILTDIYPAGEKPINGVSGFSLYEAIRNTRKDIVYIEKENILKNLLNVIKDGDIVLILGAGDITDISDELVCVLQSNQLYSKTQECYVTTHLTTRTSEHQSTGQQF